MNGGIIMIYKKNKRQVVPVMAAEIAELFKKETKLGQRYLELKEYYPKRYLNCLKKIIK